MKKLKNYKRLSLVLILSILVSSSTNLQINAASAINLYNYTTKQSQTYMDKTISYVYNGNKIQLGNTPGLLSSNGVALGSLTDIFGNVLGLKCKVDKVTKKITISDGKKTLVMTVGDQTAYLGDNSATMNAIPISVKYKDANKALTLVPTRFVAETFGYDYQWNSATSTVTISKALELSYDGNTISYDGVLGNVVVDNSPVNVSSLPTIEIADVQMIQAWKVFSQAMGVSYKANNVTGLLEFKKGAITVTMNLGSTIATINGVETDCGVAPRMVKNLDTNKSVALVPGEFLAKALGYDYTWDNKSLSSKIESTSNVGVNSQVEIVTPTLTPNPTDTITPTPTPNPTETITPTPPIVTVAPTPKPTITSTPTPGVIKDEYYNWKIQEYLAKEIDENQGVSETTTYIKDTYNMGYMYNFYRDMNISSNYETYVFSFSTPASQVKINKVESTIIIEMANTFTNQSSYYLGGDIVTSMMGSYDSDATKAFATLTLSSKDSTYSSELSDDGQTLTLHVYPNYLVKATAGIDADATKYYQFVGTNPLNPQIAEDDHFLYVTFTNTVNTIGDMQYASQDSTEISTLSTTSNTSAYMTIKKPLNYKKFSTQKTGNNFTILFEADKSDETNETIPQAKHPLEIRLPASVVVSKITEEDQYYNKKIIVKIPGNHTDFYKANPITTTYNTVKKIATAYNKTTDTTDITLTTSKIQGYQIDFSGDAMQITIGNPKEIYKNIVVLDAGHGGADPGTLKGSVFEKDIVFNILNNYAKTYFNNSTDIKVYYSRVNDTRIDLYERAKFAETVQADLFVSLHINASSNSSAKGTSVYYSTLNRSKSKNGLTSKILATEFVNDLTSTLGTKKLGVLTGNFVVVRETKVPAVLIELGFITNSSDYKLLISNSFQKKAAKSIYDTIVDIFKKYPTGR